MKIRSLAVAGALIVLTATACGDDGASAESWAKDVCGALVPWQEDVERSMSSLSGLSKAHSPGEIKEKFAGALTDAASATSTLVGKVEQAGPPDVSNGDDIQGEFVAALRQTEQSFEEAKTRASRLPTDDQQRFAQELGVLGQELVQTIDEAGKSVKQYESEEIEDAAGRVEDCKKIKG